VPITIEVAHGYMSVFCWLL